jgi:hypothetical protein
MFTDRWQTPSDGNSSPDPNKNYMLPEIYQEEIKLWKEILNSGGHPFHQYQQIEQSPLILTELTGKKRPRQMLLEIQVLAWDRHTNGVK